MATFCNKNDNRSSSEYPPFCCVHVQGSESQPLLGHHHHNPQLDSAPHHSPQYYQSEKTGPSSSLPSKDCIKSKRKIWGRILVLVLVGWFYYTFFHSSCRDYDQDRNLLKVDHGPHQSGFSGYDYCRDNAVDWNGPSTIVSTDVNNYKLVLGKGNFGTQLLIITGPVSEPTLRISGKISSGNDNDKGNRDDGNTVVVNDGDHKEFSRLGLHIEVTQASHDFEAHIWFEDRSAIDRKYGYECRPCAKLNIELILPENRDSFGSLVVRGNVLKLDAHGLQGIGFDHMDLFVNVGHIRIEDLIKADKFTTNANTGATVVKSVQVKTEAKALDVKTTSNTGAISLGVKTTYVSESIHKSSANTHHIEAVANTGSVTLDVRPSSSLSMDDKHSGHLKARVHTNTGSVRNNIQLASSAQTLDLAAESKTGSVETIISDEFLGHFNLQARIGSVKVLAARESDSTITYEKMTKSSAVGTKTRQNQYGEGSIELSSASGRVALTFMK